MSSRNDGVTADPLFLGVTRPAMAFGVTYSALLANAVVTVELFLLTRNLLWLLACVPVHGLFWLLCLSEPRFFDLAMLWGKTRGPGLFGNARLWRAQGYSALALDLPNRNGRRRARPVARVSAVDQATRLDVSSHCANARTWTSGLVRSEARVSSQSDERQGRDAAAGTQAKQESEAKWRSVAAPLDCGAFEA